MFENVKQYLNERKSNKIYFYSKDQHPNRTEQDGHSADSWV